ncbi:MAG: hypothetical protein EOQ42_31445 [Mesorhizobium sp.]|nr:MAG: hypothetical protein EOQ42_31445 [Mesorhizobium sp.]
MRGVLEEPKTGIYMHEEEKMHRPLLTALLGASVIFSLNLGSSAGEPKSVTGKVTLKANCTSGATGGDGRRKSCYSPWQEYKTPGDFVIAERSKAIRMTSANGSANDCNNHFDGYVEVIPGTGIMQPTIFRLQAHARSPRGHWSGRGWTYCEADFVQVEIQRLSEEEKTQVSALQPVKGETEPQADLGGHGVEPASVQFEESIVSE